MKLHLRQPVGEGVVRVVVVVRVDGTLHREGLGLAVLVPEFYGHALEARQLEEPLPGVPVEDACRLAEKVVRLGHLRRLLEGHAVREDGRAGVKFVSGVDALRAVSLAVVLRVLLRELALAAVSELVPALVREDRVGDYLLTAVYASGEVGGSFIFLDDNTARCPLLDLYRLVRRAAIYYHPVISFRDDIFPRHGSAAALIDSSRFRVSAIFVYITQGSAAVKIPPFKIVFLACGHRQDDILIE